MGLQPVRAVSACNGTVAASAAKVRRPGRETSVFGKEVPEQRVRVDVLGLGPYRHVRLRFLQELLDVLCRSFEQRRTIWWLEDDVHGPAVALAVWPEPNITLADGAFQTLDQSIASDDPFHRFIAIVATR